nr:MAG TPA: hypothetical protein [Caudoviricetes sp.]
MCTHNLHKSDLLVNLLACFADLLYLSNMTQKSYIRSYITCF